MEKSSENATTRKLMESYRMAAYVVKIYGDAYLPVFKRLHEEVEKTKKLADTKTLALHIAANYHESS